MVLSDKEITSAIKKGELKIFPSGFMLNPAGVDLRVDRNIRLKPKQHLLVASIDRVELSDRIVGFLHFRSFLPLGGLFSRPSLVDPGFHGRVHALLLTSGATAGNVRDGAE